MRCRKNYIALAAFSRKTNGEGSFDHSLLPVENCRFLPKQPYKYLAHHIQTPWELSHCGYAWVRDKRGNVSLLDLFCISLLL